MMPFCGLTKGEKAGKPVVMVTAVGTKALAAG